MTSRAIPILTYHSWRFATDSYADNDHVALNEDLHLMGSLGFKVVSLEAALAEVRNPTSDAPLAAITFDDGAVFDYRPVTHMHAEIDTGFFPILQKHRRHRRRLRRIQPWLHATSFVIGSGAARAQINAGLGDDFGWIGPNAWGDDWWREAHASDLMEMGNHSWDHNHPYVDTVVDCPSGDFHCIDNLDFAEKEIGDAQRQIAQQHGFECRYFAYPWGHCNEYLSAEYLPEHGAAAGLRAAVTTEPDYLRSETNVWKVPRFVCGDHWKNSAELEAILRGATVS